MYGKDNTSLFVGYFTDLTELQNQYPIGVDGQYAGVNDVKKKYYWDVSSRAWTDSGEVFYGEIISTLNSLVDTTNVAAATGYYPSATGMSMDGYKDLSLTGKIIEEDAVTDTIEVQATNDEDTTNADWVTIYGYRSDTNAMVNIITTGGSAGTYTFAIDFDNFNYSYFRVNYVMADSTNTLIIKARRKSL